jgi:hypothetical protein
MKPIGSTITGALLPVTSDITDADEVRGAHEDTESLGGPRGEIMSYEHRGHVPQYYGGTYYKS